ncbi:DoxX-like protein [Nonomuraea polychroma]|uniref:DoxX-like protein n=1 Tax=Nonomuraea polychroma TaxID=46176 RepID=A0A438M869_9ACTN|nr:DoxX family protein [Nonomuraea polychroma]RVX41902.1 DoxX-like protein [Nonomuraea polychroma]
MFTAYVIVSVLTIVANVWAAIVDFAGARFVLANQVELGLPTSWIPTLGLLKAAGAAGLVLGLMGVRLLGIAAAIGLVLYFAGAIVAHIRARVLLKIIFPGCYLALAVASLSLAVTQ